MDKSRLRQLAEAATREWRADVWIETDGNEWRATGPGHEQHAHDYGSEPGSPDEQAAQRDAAFIAAACPSTVLSLLAENEALRAQRDAMSKAHPVMLTLLAWIADEASTDDLRDMAIRYSDNADTDIWLDEHRRILAALGGDK